MSRAFLAVFAAAFMSLVLAACKDKDDGPIPKKEGRRTVLIYQSAQNSLGYDSMHRKDSIELVAAKNSIGDDDRLLVFTDDGRTSARLYRYDHKHKTPQLVKHWSGETDASDPEFLQQLLTFVREKFPSKEYGLVMWSHADGWLPSTNKNYRHAPRRSFGIDVGTGGNLYHDQTADGEVGTQMDIADMARAIEHSGIHLRYIFFDACLMQSLEVAYELRNTTDYIVASPIATPADGAYYTHMLQRGLFSSDPTDIARTFYSDVCTDGSVSNSYGGYGLVVSCLKTEGLEELATLSRSWHLSGLILTGMFQDEFFECVEKLGTPFVLIDSYIDRGDVYSIGLEDEKGGYIATRHLLENGHRVIAFASPSVRAGGVVEKRLIGYRRALAEFGVPYDPALVFTQEISVEEGRRLGHVLSEKKEITGIFASADILAAGIMTGLREKGVCVPRDKSIVGFDDNYLSQLTNPTLTTVHQDAERKGMLAADMILARVRGEAVENRSVILPVSLVERESVRRL